MAKRDNDNRTGIFILLGLAGLAVSYAALRKGGPTTGLISDFYDITDLEYSNTAIANNINNKADQSVIDNANRLVSIVLDPLTHYLGYQPWTKNNSWYRNPELNSMVGGASNSGHLYGGTIDLDSTGGNNPDIIRAIFELDLPFDQLILEYGSLNNPGHIHYSLKGSGNRNQILSTSDGSNYNFHTRANIKLLYGM